MLTTLNTTGTMEVMVVVVMLTVTLEQLTMVITTDHKDKGLTENGAVVLYSTFCEIISLYCTNIIKMWGGK